jgi:hypothetical protein
VDPGEHVVEATAPGKKPWKTTTKVPTGTGEQKVSVGPLVAEPVAVTPTPAPPPTPAPANGSATGSDVRPKKGSSAQKTIGYVALGVGVVGLGVGAVTGIMAMSKNKQSTDACPNDGACGSKDALDANKSAKDLGTISTIGFIAGGVCAATGLVLVLTGSGSSAQSASSTSAPKTGIRIVPTAGASSAGLTAFGVF